MILMEEVMKLGGEESTDRIEDIAIAMEESSFDGSAVATDIIVPAVQECFAMSAEAGHIIVATAVQNSITEPAVRSIAEFTMRWSEYRVKIRRGNHALYTQGHEKQAMKQIAAEKETVENYVGRLSGLSTPELMEAVKLKSAEKEKNHPGKLNPEEGDAGKDKKPPGKLNPEKGDAGKDEYHPIKLEKAVKDKNNKINPGKQTLVNGAAGKEHLPGKQNPGKDTAGKESGEKQSSEEAAVNNKEGGHALRSLLPEGGGALHGAHSGGEASQLNLTSFEVLHKVRGGHALPGAQPDEGHQEVGQPHHPDVGNIPTNDGEEQFAARNTYDYARSAGGESYKTNRKTELPRHKALIPASCPEDSMGGDLVEYPVVFLAGPSHVVRKQERVPGKLVRKGSLGSERS